MHENVIKKSKCWMLDKDGLKACVYCDSMFDTRQCISGNFRQFLHHYLVLKGEL